MAKLLVDVRLLVRNLDELDLDVVQMPKGAAGARCAFLAAILELRRLGNTHVEERASTQSLGHELGGFLDALNIVAELFNAIFVEQCFVHRRSFLVMITPSAVWGLPEPQAVWGRRGLLELQTYSQRRALPDRHRNPSSCSRAERRIWRIP